MQKKACKSGYTVYDWNGNVLFTVSQGSNVKKGDKVKVKFRAKDYSGSSLASFVYKNTYTILEISGDRVVIGVNGAVTAAVHKNNLTKA